MYYGSRICMLYTLLEYQHIHFADVIHPDWPSFAMQLIPGRNIERYFLRSLLFISVDLDYVVGLATIHEEDRNLIDYRDLPCGRPVIESIGVRLLY